MHPTDRKSALYGLIIIAIAIPINLVCFNISNWFSYILYGAAIFAMIRFKISASAVVFVGIFSILSNLIVLGAIYLLFLRIPEESYINLAVATAGIFAYIILFLLLSIGSRFDKLLSFIENEKRDYDKIKKHPDLICRKHRTRTVIKKRFTFKNVQCRINENCNENDIVFAKQMVFVVGKPAKPIESKNNFNLIIWNLHKEEIVDGDYDRIEIYKNEEIENHDAVINKMVRYFYNEINRYKPINQIAIKIFDNIELSESTKRLMEKYFLKVEYASN